MAATAAVDNVASQYAAADAPTKIATPLKTASRPDGPRTAGGKCYHLIKRSKAA